MLRIVRTSTLKAMNKELIDMAEAIHVKNVGLTDGWEENRELSKELESERVESSDIIVDQKKLIDALRKELKVNEAQPKRIQELSTALEENEKIRVSMFGEIEKLNTEHLEEQQQDAAEMNQRAAYIVELEDNLAEANELSDSRRKALSKMTITATKKNSNIKELKAENARLRKTNKMSKYSKICSCSLTRDPDCKVHKGGFDA